VVRLITWVMPADRAVIEQLREDLHGLLDPQGQGLLRGLWHEEELPTREVTALFAAIARQDERTNLRM